MSADPWQQLVGQVAEQRFPLLPRPEWPQDVAYIAFVIDTLVEYARDESKIRFLLDSYSLWSEEGTFTFPDGETVWRSNETTPEVAPPEEAPTNVEALQ